MQFGILIPVHNPSKKAHPQNEIRACLDNMNFGNVTILPHCRPEKCQKSDPERHEFWERHDSSTL